MINDISKAYRLSINTCLIFDKCLSIFDKLCWRNKKIYENNKER